jgi:hypothetical protein
MPQIARSACDEAIQGHVHFAFDPKSLRRKRGSRRAKARAGDDSVNIVTRATNSKRYKSQTI